LNSLKKNLFKDQISVTLLIFRETDVVMKGCSKAAAGSVN
jgi:flagellar biosynthesis regulator FlaF